MCIRDSLISGSSQVLFNGLSGLPSGLISSSAQLPSGLISGSSQISFTGISNVPSGLVSGSSQISFTGISNIPSGLISSSAQLPSGLISSSAQLPSGLISSSAQLPSGLVSSSASGDITGSAHIVPLINASYNLGSSGSRWDRVYVSGSIDAFKDLNFYVDGNNDMRLDQTGSLHVEGDVIAFSTTITSDENLKYDIVPIQNPLEKIAEIRGVEFYWKKNNELSAGVIAQEVQKILPQAVKEVESVRDGTKHLTVNYDAVVGLLVQSVKELREEVEYLKSKL